MSYKKMKYAHIKRRVNRKAINYISHEELLKIKKDSLEMIKSIWSKSIGSALLPKDIYKLIDAELRLRLKTPTRFMRGRIELLRFIQLLNVDQQKLGLPEYPEPALPKRILRVEPVKDLHWLLKGQKVAELADQAMNIWSAQKNYTIEDILGWTLLSAILWGGLNDQLVIEDFLSALTERRQLYFLAELGLHYVQLDADDNNYGSHHVNGQLKRSYSFVLDDITRSWIVRLQKETIPVVEMPRSVEHLLNGVLDQLETSIRYDRKRSAVLLKYASYHWELIPNVKVDHATVRVLDKQQRCCSLSTPELLHFLRPDIQRQPLQLDIKTLLKGSFPQAQSTAIKKTEQEEFASNAIANIRNIFKTFKNKQLFGAIPHLEELASQQTSEGHARLIAWAIDLIRAEHTRSKLRGSSVMRYVDAIAKDWLTLTYQEDITVFHEIQFEKIYKDMIELRTNNKSFYGQRILRFHQFQRRQYNAPDIEFDVEYGGQTCRARVVPYLVFREMCSALDRASGINPANRELCKLLLIMAYRTGLRREELVGIEFADLEFNSINFNNLCFIIHNNSSSKIKTDSAYRRIPVWALLKRDELKLLTNYLQAKWPQSKVSMRTPIFTHSVGDQPLPSELPYNLVIALFNNVLKSHNFNFHAFRHTALSNLALILDGRPELIEFFTDYTSDDCKDIKAALLGIKSNGQDRWFGLAQFAGHLSPYTTFAVYLHFSHLMGGFAISQGKVDIPLTAFINITSYEKRRIDRNAPDSIDKGTQHIELSKVRSILSRDLSSISIEIESVSKQCELRDKMGNSKNIMPICLPDSSFQLPGSDNNPITMLTFNNFLQQLNEGFSVSTACSTLDIELAIGEQWEERAIHLSQLPTQTGQPRLFTKERLAHHKNAIAPFRPPHREEQNVLAILFENAVKLHQKNPSGLHRFLDIFLNRVTATNGEIRFRLKEIEILRDYLLVGHQLLSISNWRLQAPTPKEIVELKEIMKSLNPDSPVFSLITQSDELKKNLALFDRLSKEEPINYNGFYLSVIHPKKDGIKKKNTNSQNSTTGLLKYACHILAIADISYQLPPIKGS